MPVTGIRPTATSINAGLSPIPSAPNLLGDLPLLARPARLPRTDWPGLRVGPTESVRIHSFSNSVMPVIGIRPTATSISAGLSPTLSAPNASHDPSVLFERTPSHSLVRTEPHSSQICAHSRFRRRPDITDLNPDPDHFGQCRTLVDPLSTQSPWRPPTSRSPSPTPSDRFARVESRSNKSCPHS
jgi:hypothetical protein